MSNAMREIWEKITGVVPGGKTASGGGGEVIELDYTEGNYPIGFPVSPQEVLEKIKSGVHLVVDVFDNGPEIHYYLNVAYNVMNEDIVVYGISHSNGSNATMRVYFVGNLTTNEWTEIL